MIEAAIVLLLLYVFFLLWKGIRGYQIVEGSAEFPDRHVLWQWNLGWEPRDIWIGSFWDRGAWKNSMVSKEHFTIYICLLPCFPLAFHWIKEEPIT